MIVVPALDADQMDSELMAGLPEHRVCIDAEPDMEPNSPKTITESSSKITRSSNHRLNGIRGVNLFLFIYLETSGLIETTQTKIF